MSELKEMKLRKEGFRIEIRKAKQDKSLHANRLRLLKESLFEQDDHSLLSNRNCSKGNEIGVFQAYSTDELRVLVNVLLQQIKESENSWQMETNTKSSHSTLNEIMVLLGQFEGAFKQIGDNNCEIFQNAEVHVKLFQYLQAILTRHERALQEDLEGAEGVLSKLFQFLVSICLHSEKALEDCIRIHVVEYFLNVMISPTFFAKKSKMILYSVNLLDHIASKQELNQLNFLIEKEVPRQVLTLMKDILKTGKEEKSELLEEETSDSSHTDLVEIDTFHRKVLLHLSSVLSNISRHGEFVTERLKCDMLEVCQQLLTAVSSLVNEKTSISKFYASLPNKDNKSEFEEEDPAIDQDNTLDETPIKELNRGNQSDQKTMEELLSVETYLSATILNVIEMMSMEDMDIYISDNIEFLLFVHTQILPFKEHSTDNNLRIQQFGEIINGILMGDEDQLDLVIETFSSLEYIFNMIYSPFENVSLTGLSCLYNILISSSESLFEEVCDNDPNIVSRLLVLANLYSGSSQLHSHALNALAAFVDKADSDLLTSKLYPTHVMNIIIQKIDPNCDQSTIKAALVLLESLLMSEDQTLKEDQDTSNADQDNYWALKFQANPAGNSQVTKLLNSCHSKDIILKLDSILDQYMD